MGQVTTITSSTISDNATAAMGGGGILVSKAFNGPAAAQDRAFAITRNVTVYGNAAPANLGGGIRDEGGFIDRFGHPVPSRGGVLVQNTIVANSLSGGECSRASGARASDVGGNISSDSTCSAAFFNEIAPVGNHVLNKLNTNPMLGPLANNGGSTLTHLPLAGSPAIDGGDNFQCPATDQRGLSRPSDGNNDGLPVCDVGAVEVAGLVLSPPGISKAFEPEIINTGGKSTLTLTFTNNNATRRLTNVSVDDGLPVQQGTGGMDVAAAPNVRHNCGPNTVVDAQPRSSHFSIRGATLEPMASCFVSLDVTGTGIGTMTNNTGPVTALETGTGLAASAQLTVVPPAFQTPTSTPSTTSVLPAPTATPSAPPVIPQQVQNPAAIQAVLGGIGNGTRNNTPMPSRPVVADPPSAVAPAGPLLITPPRTGDAGLAAHLRVSIF